MQPSEDGYFNLTSCLFASFHFCLILLNSFLFFTYPCYWLAIHVSWAFPIICGFLFIASIIFFLFASFTDTGILHKGVKEELVNQAVIRRTPNHQWCSQCQLYCRPHTFHCSWCNACVEDFCLHDFDHHCLWVNNCIGCHNVHFFDLFNSFLSLYCLAMMISCYAYSKLSPHQESYSMEDVCIHVVFIPTLFYLFLLLSQLTVQANYVRTTQDKLQDDTSQEKLFKFCRAWRWLSVLRTRKEPKEKSAKPKARSEEARKVSPVSSFGLMAPSPSRSCSPPDMPGEQATPKAWHHFLAAVGSLLHWKGPRLEESTQQAGKKKSSWPLQTTDRRVEEILIPEMVDSVQLLDEDQDAHWKCQVYINRRTPSSPTGTLLSLSDI